MTETDAKVTFLCKIASSIPADQNNSIQNVLRSYYFMKCKEEVKGYGLPEKHFSTNVRCPHCCLEWKKGTTIKVNPIKLSKRQRKRRKYDKSKNSKGDSKEKNLLLHYNEMEKICTFCKKSFKTDILKPDKQKPTKTNKELTKITSTTSKKETVTVNKTDTNQKLKPKVQNINVYSNAIDVFAMNNKNNILPSKVKEPPKIINNNKRKKDRYAGLCEMAVKAAAKMKEEKRKQHNSKLNMFLKPSS